MLSEQWAMLQELRERRVKGQGHGLVSNSLAYLVRLEQMLAGWIHLASVLNRVGRKVRKTVVRLVTVIKQYVRRGKWGGGALLLTYFGLTCSKLRSRCGDWREGR